MPTSARGSERGSQRGPGHARRRSGFTLIELLVVLALVAVAAGIVTLTLRDADAARLDEEGERLAVLLEMARAEARASAAPVRFIVAAGGDAAADFRFVGLPPGRTLPQRWLDRRIAAQVLGAPALVLGPDAILPPQRVLLSLGDRRLELASDGLAPFAVAGVDAR